jgi:formate dehydrogenase subunit gamma
MLNDEQHIPWSDETAQETIGAHAGQRGPLLPVLHALQETFGYVDPRAVPLVAKALNLSRADVFGVLTFYSDLRSTPPGTLRVQVCRGEACQAVGGQVLAEHATGSLGVSFGQTATDGSVTLDEVFCLGNCALGPSVAVNGHLHGRVSASGLDALMSLASPAAGGSHDSTGDTRRNTIAASGEPA